jgi:hypothetical protein
MGERAKVGSLEALEAFRAQLVVYLSKARPLVGEASTELRRFQGWLATEQTAHWDREFRRRSRAAEEAEQALFSARLSSFRDSMGSEQMLVQKTRRALVEVEEKRRALKGWLRDFPGRTDSLARQVEVLDSVLVQDMGRAVAWLGEAIRRLSEYAELKPEGTRLEAGRVTDRDPGEEPGQDIAEGEMGTSGEGIRGGGGS